MFDKIKNLFKKRVYLYLVYRNENENSLVTVLEKKEQINEFVNRNIIVENFNHFKLWCELRNMDYTQVESENAYINNFLTTSNEEDLNKYSYIIKKVYYSRKAIASILRMFNGCFPLGCSYETHAEEAYLDLMYKEAKKELDE